jgi:hypothetical protein
MDVAPDRLSLLLIGAYFLFLVISLTRRGRVVSGPWWFLLRSFFPNWRFYHGAGHQPRLFWRAADARGAWSDWQMFMPRARLSWVSLIHNPRHNLTLAEQNLVDHLSADLAQLPEDADVRQLVTYQMVQRLTRWLIECEGGSPTSYQFQVRLVPAMAAMPDEHDAVLTSPVLGW